MKHGRKSRDDKAQAFDGGHDEVRPSPPSDMNARQQELWRLIVNDEPVTHFATEATRQLLANFIFHLQQSEALKAAVSKEDLLHTEEGRAAYQELTRHLYRHMTGAARLASKLRLTNQSRYTPMAAASASRNTLKGVKPWQI